METKYEEGEGGAWIEYWIHSWKPEYCLQSLNSTTLLRIFSKGNQLTKN